MPLGRMGRPGLIGMAARTAVVALELSIDSVQRIWGDGR